MNGHHSRLRFCTLLDVPTPRRMLHPKCAGFKFDLT